MINSLQRQFPRWRELTDCAQFKILFTFPTQHYCPLPPSLLERGNGGEDSAGASLQIVPNSEFKIQNSQFKMRYTLWQTFRVCQSF